MKPQLAHPLLGDVHARLDIARTSTKWAHPQHAAVLDHPQAPEPPDHTGPFVDCKHRLLDPSAAGQPGGFSNGVPPDTATIMRAVMRDRIAKALAGTTTACIIVPSPSDVHARPLFPQPAFSADVVNGEDGGMPVVLMSNPCTFKINEVVFQVCS